MGDERLGMTVSQLKKYRSQTCILVDMIPADGVKCGGWDVYCIKGGKRGTQSTSFNLDCVYLFLQTQKNDGGKEKKKHL